MLDRLLDLDSALVHRAEWKRAQQRVVFTNGVFDILHRGHCMYLAQARAHGDLLVLGLNSDASVRAIKGPNKPIVPQEDRAAVLLALRSVDYVVMFDEETPRRLITALLPDVLVKGGDYTLDGIVGRDEVEAAGGRVLTIPFLPERSSTNIIQTVLDRLCP